MTTPTAANRVFNITELLEMILLELPMRRILLLQRLNRFTNQTISGSTPIQKKLFFIPGNAEDTYITRPPHKWDPVVDTDQQAQLRREFVPDSVISEGVVFNPILVKNATRLDKDHAHPKQSGVWLRPELFTNAPHSKASFKRMYVTQPPTLLAVARVALEVGRQERCVKVASKWDGLSEGEKFEELTEWLSSLRGMESVRSDGWVKCVWL